MPKGDKYINLTNYLKNINEENVKMSFKDIENLLGEKLCDSAYKYAKFWSNTESHSIYFGWFNAGYKKKFVDMRQQMIIFEKNTNTNNFKNIEKVQKHKIINNNISLPFEIASKNIKKYFNKTLNDEQARYLSWDYCFYNFTKYRNNLDEGIIDYLSLSLHSYLGSWGMFRQSSFLSQKNYKVHIPVVKFLQNEKYNCLVNIAAEKLLEQNTLALLDELTYNIINIYSEQVPSFEEKKNSASDTLITKILFVVYGCVPAYDRFYKKAVKTYNISSMIYNDKSIKNIAEYYCSNKKSFERLRMDLSKKNKLQIEYPPMKLMDMCMWQIGYDLNEEGKK